MWNRETPSQSESARQVTTPAPTVTPPPAVAPAPAPAVTSRPAEQRRVVTWVGKSVVFRGDLVSEEDMTIDGRVEGTIELDDHHLTIGPDAHIQAAVVAKVVTILGTVTGTIIASERIDVRESGSVDGDLTAPRLAVAEGAVLHGRVDTGRVDDQKNSTAQVTASV
jgi:cytoskeletal protein CcmA (bactofilin family)